MEADPDTDDDARSDADILKARREALRAFVDDIAAHIQKLDLPETYLEAERAARCITVHDRAIQTLPLHAGEIARQAGDPANAAKTDSNSESHAPEILAAMLKPIRRSLRRYADRVMEAVTFITRPDSFLEGERAGRYALAADRMLSQLYEAPAPKHFGAPARPARTRPVFADDLDDAEDEDEAADPEAQARMHAALDRKTREYVRRHCGVWPDGTPYLPGEPEPQYPFDQADRVTLLAAANPARIPETLLPPSVRGVSWLLFLINRLNAPTRARARLDGHWPDDTPYSDDDPDYYSISERYDELQNRKPPKPPSGIIETPGPPDFPAWIVHKLPP